MGELTVKCFNCNKKFRRERGRYNEAMKNGWNHYCSRECQDEARLRRIEKICANPKCSKNVSRQLNQFKKSKSGLIFCSISCAAIFHNSKRQKRGTCLACGKEFLGHRKYCSKPCRSNTLKGKVLVTKSQIIKKIKGFYNKHGRIPVKREFFHYDAARYRFGTWNNAIRVAGFKPNPVIFAKKHRAKDGHKCDSLSEKIVDDWFFENHIEHKINVSYPENIKLTCDFVANKYFIEFFGLEEEHPRYTELVAKKRKLAKEYNLDLIELKPRDLFPKNKLDVILKFLLSKKEIGKNSSYFR